jgi:hypothetical protein
MDGNLRADLPGQSNQPQILNDDGIDLGFSHPTKEPFGFDEFRGEDQHVEGEISATSTGMEVIHDEGEICLSEIFSSETGIERGESEIDGVGTCGNGSFEALPIACRG